MQWILSEKKTKMNNKRKIKNLERGLEYLKQALLLSDADNKLREYGILSLGLTIKRMEETLKELSQD